MSSGLERSALPGSPGVPEESGHERLLLRDILGSFERDLIVTVLIAAGGNQKRAARALGVLPTTFQEKLKRFGLLSPRSAKRPRRDERPRVQTGGDAPTKTHTQPQPEDQE